MRTKQKYEAEVRGRIHAEGRNVIIPVSLKCDPARPVEVRIPRSKVVPMLRAAINAAEKIEQISS